MTTVAALRTTQGGSPRAWWRPRGTAAFLLVPAMALFALAVAAAAVLVRAGLLVPPADDSAEAGFARDMSVHHAQAVQMAEIVRERTADDEVRLLAMDIALTQQAQIGRMQGWLDAWGLLPTGRAPAMAWMGHAGGRMPGLAAAEEVPQLRDLPPSEADRVFLELMIRHHQGGVAMAEALLARGARPEVERLARGIVASQEAEIATMREMLRRRGADVPGAASEPGAHDGTHSNDVGEAPR